MLQQNLLKMFSSSMNACGGLWRDFASSTFNNMRPRAAHLWLMFY